MDYSTNNKALHDALFLHLVDIGTLAWRFASASGVALVDDAQEQIVKFAKIKIEQNKSCLKNIRCSLPDNLYGFNPPVSPSKRFYVQDFIEHIASPSADHWDKGNLVFLAVRAFSRPSMAYELLECLYKGIPIDHTSQWMHWPTLNQLHGVVPGLQYNGDWLDLVQYIDDVVQENNDRKWPVPHELQDKTLGSDYEKNAQIVQTMYQFIAERSI